MICQIKDIIYILGNKNKNKNKKEGKRKSTHKTKHGILSTLLQTSFMPIKMKLT